MIEDEYRHASKEASRMAVESTECYKIGAILYVPHHTRQGIFIGPGGMERTLLEVMRLGQLRREYLWARPRESA